MSRSSQTTVQDVDIGGGCKRIESAQEDLRYGHTVQESIQNAKPFSSVENRYFERTFDFDCPEMPTSFHFRVTFIRAREGIVNTVGSVRRKDQGAGLVNVTLVAIVSRNDDRLAFSRHRFHKLPAGGVDRVADCVLLKENTLELERADDLTLEFALTILCCHDDEEATKAKKTPHSKDSHSPSPSKKRRCVQSSS